MHSINNNVKEILQWKEQHNETAYCVILTNNLKTIKWGGRQECRFYGKQKRYTEFWLKCVRGKDHYGAVRLDQMITLNALWRKMMWGGGEEICNSFVCLRTRSHDEGNYFAIASQERIYSVELATDLSVLPVWPTAIMDIVISLLAFW
jgi:hypothetical protein